MPAPPPPPPLAPAAPPPPTSMFKSSKSSSGGAVDRGALLKSIQKGAKLKKAVTNDRSAPQLGGSSNKSSNNGGMGGGIGGMPLPMLQIGGMGGNHLRNGNASSGGGGGGVTPVSPLGGMKNFGSIQMELKKQLANDSRNRGPPPPTPTRNIPPDTGGRQLFNQRDNVTNGFHLSHLSLNTNNTHGIPVNQSSLHRKAKSNANLSSLDIPDNSNGFRPSNKPVINHGKPNLAPKPPGVNGKPNTLQLKPAKPVSRTHSLKSPRSPSPQSPDTNSMNKFGTVRHMSSIISQSLANSSSPHNPRPRPAISTRPTAPPPSIPVPATPNHQSMSSSHTSTPPKLSMVKPNHAPPPPPPMVLPQAPSHAPPPPPHKTQMSKTPAPLTGSNPPSPPPRHSSMRDNNNVTKRAGNFEEKFKHLFQSSSKFPSPPPYKNVIKLYNSVSVKSAPVKPVSVA